MVVLRAQLPTLLIFAVACGPEPSGGWVGQTGAPLEVDNGIYLNSPVLNGVYLNDTQQNGVYLNGVYLNGVYLNGVYLNSGELLGVDPGSIMVGQLSDGSTIETRIDSIRELDPTDPDHDVFAYVVSARVAGGAWWPLCGTDQLNQPIEAIPLRGVWNYQVGVAGGGSKTDDPSRFTFACRGAALAKCVEMGYKPWKTVRGISLADHHQSCTRVVRADYCGNGQTFTQSGRAINLYDGIGIQGDTERWLIEAEWDAGGARCMSGFRRDMTVRPPCFERLFRPERCGGVRRFSNGTLLINEIWFR